MAARSAALLARSVVRIRVELAELHVEHSGGQLGHPQVEPEERPLADLDAAAQREVALVVQREAALVDDRGVSVTSMPPSPHVMVL